MPLMQPIKVLDEQARIHKMCQGRVLNLIHVFRWELFRLSHVYIKSHNSWDRNVSSRTINEMLRS